MRGGRGRKLDSRQVVRLRQMVKEGFGRRFLSKAFGVSVTVIRQVLAHSTYKDIK